MVEMILHLVLQARKLKYKLEDVRRRGRREEVGKVENGELGRTEEQAGKSNQLGRTEEQAGRSNQVGRTDPGEKKEEQENENEEGEERSEVTQVCNILQPKISFNCCYYKRFFSSSNFISQMTCD